MDVVLILREHQGTTGGQFACPRVHLFHNNGMGASNQTVEH